MKFAALLQYKSCEGGCDRNNCQYLPFQASGPELAHQYLTMYTTRLASIGGNGGAPFNHSEHLQQQGYSMGCGSKAMRLMTLHVEQMIALDYLDATYTSWSDAAATCDVPSKGYGTRRHGESNTDLVCDIDIGPNERVTMVAGEYGRCRYPCYAYGDQTCLHSITFTIESVDGHTRSVTAGRKNFQDDYYQTPGTRESPDGALKVVQVPPGLTVAGISGCLGDLWYTSITLHACPYLPGYGVWNRALHKHYCWPFKKQVQTVLLCLHRLSKHAADQPDQSQLNPALPWLPPTVKECLIAALFKETFMAPTRSGTAAAAAEKDYISEWVKTQAEKCGDQAGQLLRWWI